MRTALDGSKLPEFLDAQLWDYLVMAAHSLVNAAAGGHPRTRAAAATWASRRGTPGWPALRQG